MPKQSINVGRLGLTVFDEGFYAYVGSAMNGIEGRVSRHLRETKKPHWHIDYLSNKATAVRVIICESDLKMECGVAAALLRRLVCVSRFGCTDCGCRSHLFFHRDDDILSAIISDELYELSIDHEVVSQAEFVRRYS